MTTKPQNLKNSYLAPEYKPAKPTLMEKLAPYLSRLAHVIFVIFMLVLIASFLKENLSSPFEAITLIK